MLTFTAQRLSSDGMSIISAWRDPGGLHLCYALEPGALRDPHPAVPSGIYALRLRTVGAKHAAYLKRFGPAFHKGMVEICGVPGRDAIEFHIGNSIADTLGCSLAGQNKVPPEHALSRHWEVAQSETAYRRVYPILLAAIMAGPTYLTVTSTGGSQ